VLKSELEDGSDAKKKVGNWVSPAENTPKRQAKMRSTSVKVSIPTFTCEGLSRIFLHGHSVYTYIQINSSVRIGEFSMKKWLGQSFVLSSGPRIAAA
jgi:hypothetical protein